MKTPPPTLVPVRSDARLKPRRFVQIVQGACIFSVVAGLSVLVGWIFDFRPLITVLPGLVAMKPNTAIGLVFAGLSLFLFVSSLAGLKPLWRKLSVGLAVAVVGLGVLTAGEYVTGFNLRIDGFVFRDYVANLAAPYPPGRMAPLSAFKFVCLGSALDASTLSASENEEEQSESEFPRPRPSGGQNEFGL